MVSVLVSNRCSGISLHPHQHKLFLTKKKALMWEKRTCSHSFLQVYIQICNHSAFVIGVWERRFQSYCEPWCSGHVGGHVIPSLGLPLENEVGCLLQRMKRKLGGINKNGCSCYERLIVQTWGGESLTHSGDGEWDRSGNKNKIKTGLLRTPRSWFAFPSISHIHGMWSCFIRSVYKRVYKWSFLHLWEVNHMIFRVE